jgi:hypothetical protein
MIMQAQTPAVGILKRNDWGDSMTYQVVCECGDSNHDHNIWIEAEDSGVIVTIYTRQKSKWWNMNRWQKIWTLLTRGYIEYEASIIMNEQEALNYTETLKRAIIDVKQFRKEHDGKN